MVISLAAWTRATNAGAKATSKMAERRKMNLVADWVMFKIIFRII
jgi:hypothetical protein